MPITGSATASPGPTSAPKLARAVVGAFCRPLVQRPFPTMMLPVTHTNHGETKHLADTASNVVETVSDVHPKGKACARAQSDPRVREIILLLWFIFL